MGIETALIAGVGGSLIGNYFKSKGEQKGAAAKARGITAATEASNLRLQPYAQAGTQSLEELQGLMTPEGQAQFATDYRAGPQYQQFQEQAELSALRNASATGGMRTGQTGVALSTIDPQLINTALDKRMQGLQALTAQGANVAGQQAGTTFQGGMAATAPQYAADTSMSNFAGNALSTLSGLGFDAYAQGMAPTQVMTRPGQTYGR